MDALQDPSYLLSVVEIIAESTASIHTLLDAYATFVNRVRFHSQSLEVCDALLPALIPITLHKDHFIQALRRDIRLAHSDPFSRPRSSLDEISVCLDIKIDTKQYARDSSALCYHALCAVTTIFRFPAFYFVLPEHDLSSLFGDVLDVALADQLPVLNEAKTYSWSLWALGCHRLPLTVLESRRDDVFSALRRSLDSTRQRRNIVLDGLKAISHTVERHPSAVLELLSPLLPSVITNLNCRSFKHRLHASIALGKFANALIHQSELSLTKWQSISNHVSVFLESCCDESQVAPGDMSFLCMIRNAFSAESHATRADDPTRILAVIASLIILCGPTLYRKPTVLHFILQSLAMALTHKRSIVRALHPHVWRCFVWTFGQILLSSEHVDPTLISSAIYVVKQEVSGGIGHALTSVLLSDRLSENRPDVNGDRLSQALSVVKAMARTECKHTRREAFMFLQAFTNDAQARHQILHNVHEIPASVLLDGTVTHAELDSLPSIIHSIPKVPIHVRWPEETEIAQHYKTLIVIWTQFASKADKKHSDSGLVDMWLSILLLCAHQLECREYSIATTETLKYIATIIVECLPSWVLEDCRPDWGSWDVHDQLCSLTFISQLWSAMKRAFNSLALAEVAEFILSSVLQYAFHVLDGGIRTLWGKLCANLMTMASPSFLLDAVPATSKLVIRSQRELWGVVATCLSSDLSLDWAELIQFLAIPICTWALSELELQAWEAIFRNAITVSGDSALVIKYIILQYFQEREVGTWDSIMAVLGVLLTFTREHGSSPIGELLNMVDSCLLACYNRALHSLEVLTYSLKLLDGVRHVIAAAPSNVMHILQALRNSLCLWIEDHTEVMSDDQFNSVAVALYCEALKALEVVPLSIQCLQDTEHFLASAFSRIPAPAVAPFAFEQFWKATYHGKTPFCNNLPSKIKFCLSCFVAAYGGNIADGVSLTTESQSQSISNESQVHSTIHRYEAWTDMEATHERQHTATSQDDATFLIPTPDDDVPQPITLRQPQYACRIDESSAGGSEWSMSSPGMVLLPILSSIHPPEKIHPVTPHSSNQKRKLAHDNNAAQKRSRILRATLRLVRELESEPATRDVTPVGVPRMNSVPLRKRTVFDGVEVPTCREVSRRKMVQSSERRKNIVNLGGLVSVPQTPSSHGKRRKSRTPKSGLPASDEDILGWENLRVDQTSSEADVDRSLANALCSSPLIQVSPYHSDAHAPGSSQQKAMSQSESSPPTSVRPSLRRVMSTSSRLDALRDVYSSFENGGSQIPLPELMQATTLVHQIGVALNAKMEKKLENMDKETG